MSLHPEGKSLPVSTSGSCAGFANKPERYIKGSDQTFYLIFKMLHFYWTKVKISVPVSGKLITLAERSSFMNVGTAKRKNWILLPVTIQPGLIKTISRNAHGFQARMVCLMISVLLMTLSPEAMAAPNEKKAKNSVAGIFFDERIAQDGFFYAYPKTSMISVTRETAKKGRSSLLFELAPDSFSGASICLHAKMYNIRQYLTKGAVQFWVKGSTGTEKAWVALVDEAATDNRKTVVRVDVSWFGKIDTCWSFISIPLEHFGANGVYWDEKEQREIEAPFNWNSVAEFRLESRKDENTFFKVWVDDIVVVKSLR